MSEGSTTVRSGGGVGFLGLLTIVFVVAKLWGVIDWSWWWVFSPVLFGIGVWVALVVVLFGVAGALRALEKRIK